MKKLFLIITVLVMTLLVSCNGTGNNGQQSGGGTSQGSYDPSKPLIWNPETDVYLVSSAGVERDQIISDEFTELTGNILMPSSDANGKNEHELVIGQSTRPISQAAYHLLDRNMTEDEDAEGYVVLVQDGSVAVAYSSDAAYSAAMEAFYNNCCFPNYHADNGPVFWDFYSLSLRAEENRDKMYTEGFAKLEAVLVEDGAKDAAAIVKELKNYYSLYSTEMLYWLADLYDPELGAFYYSNTGRDNFGFLPDLESTAQVLQMLDRSGLFSVIGGIDGGSGSLPSFITEPMINWARSLQSSEDGYFYHPQWGTSIAAARKGRDLDNAVAIFRITKAAPYYNDPSGRMKGTLGAYGENAVQPAVALTSRLGQSAVKAVSAITPVALPGGPDKYLSSLEAWRDYVDNLNINDSGVSYGTGNTLVSQWSVIKSKGKAYTDYLINYLNEHMYPDIGLWEYQNENDYDNEDKVGYNGVNGLMKICVLYSSLGYAVPNAYNALQSVVKVGLYPNIDPKDETMCYAFNVWTCLGSMINNVKAHDPDNYPAAKQLLVDNMAGLLSSSYDLNHTHLMDDGSFSYYERRDMNVSQSAPVGCARGPESDVNSAMLGTSSITGAMFGVLKAVFDGVEYVPIWGPDDYYVFMGELEKAGKVYKNEIPQAEVIDFNDYVEADMVEGTEKQPDDDIYLSINTTWFNSNVVQRPGTDVADADLALRMESMVDTEFNGTDDMPLRDEKGNYIMATAPSNAYVAIGNTYGNGDCYSLEVDLLFEEADIGQILQIFLMNSRLGSNFYLTGLQFNTYKNGDETGIRLVDLYGGLDGAYNYNLYEKLKVGEWFKIKLEVYKVYIENADETQTLELYIKIYINDKYITTTDSSYMVSNKVNDIEPDKVMFSQYRYRGSTIYFDNILAERKDKEYEKEIVHNEVTFDDGTILSSPAISVNAGTASGTLVNNAIKDGDTEGGNERNYFKIRKDVAGKVDDAVLEVYHKANKKSSGYGTSNINIGITDGSTSGFIFVLEFDMMVNKIVKYNASNNYFTRIRIGSSGNAGLYHDFTSNGTDILCRNNGSGNNKLGTFGEWFHVKMIWNIVNASGINQTDPTAPTVEFYLITYDSEGNEVLADFRSLYTSYVATNKSVTNVFFCGSENSSDFDQQYFLDNITYIRTSDTSILPAKPESN